MSHIFTPVLCPETIVDSAKEAHLHRINDLQKSCKLEMLAYVEKYVLNGREFSVLFRDAHQDAFDYVSDEGCLSTDHVLEYIIDFEELFQNQGCCDE